MNTVEENVIRREQASHNNMDLEKAKVVGPDAG
jgi:hypothetical protein